MTDKRIAADINAMIGIPARPAELPPAVNAPAQRSRRGMATTPQSSGGGGGGGSIGTLVETPGSREYHSPETIIPPDGFFFYSVRPVKKLYFEGGSVELQPPGYGEEP